MIDWNGEVVVVGSGAAGHSCARTLREFGFSGRITMVDTEGADAAIDRTMLDVAVLSGRKTLEEIALEPLQNVEIVRARTVSLGPADGASAGSTGTPDSTGTADSVVLADGRELRGDALVIACGSTPRALGAEVELDPSVPLHYIYEAADIERLKEAVPDPAAANIAIIGAGFIGSEVAGYYARSGAHVTLIGRAELAFADALGSEIAGRFAALQGERVEARFGAGVRAVRAEGSGSARIELDDGSPDVIADTVIVAVGSRPATEWAGYAGPIVTDDRMRVTGRTGVYAAGSAAAPETSFGALRIDHWDAAAAQGELAAQTLLHDFGGAVDPGPYEPTTGFFLMVHGAAMEARGVRAPGAIEENTELEDGGVITEFVATPAGLTGVVGWKAKERLAAAAERLGRG